MNDQLKQSGGTIRVWFDEHVSPRYQQLENREQKTVRIAAIVLPLILILFGLLLPLQDQQKLLQTELAHAQDQALEAEGMARYLRDHATGLKASNATSENLLSLVERLARESKVRDFMTRIKPQTSLGSEQERLMLRMKDAPYDATLRFIHALTVHKLELNSLTLQSTNSPSLIHVRAVISGF